jgi:secretion/DNA translocation related CpaE-like protein
VPTPSPRPLVVTADPAVLDDVLRLAVTADVEVEVAPDLGAARPAWRAAPLVVVGDDAARGAGRRRLPRRPDVVLVGTDLDDADVWVRAVDLGAEHVVFLPDADAWLVERLADAAESPGPAAVLLAVVGGRGGAGATTLAAALAVTAARAGRRVLLVDGDPLGGGIDLVFGGEADGGLRWPDLGGTRGRLPSAALADALPRMADVSVLSWDRGDAHPVGAEAVAAVLAAGRRAHELVVVDLPRALDEGARTVLAEATRTLLVVPAEVRAAAAASRVAAAVTALCPDVRLVVRGPAPGGLGGEEIARALALPLVREMPEDTRVSGRLERGEPPARRGTGPLWELCSAVVADLLPPLEPAA